MFSIDYIGDGKYCVFKDKQEYIVGDNPKHLITSLMLDPELANNDINIRISEAVQMMMANDPDEHFSFIGQG